MSEISENIRSTFTNMVKIYEETARFFLDADDLMTRNGYRVLKGSALESETSRSLNHPRWWLMFSGVRYYIPEENPEVARAIGVYFYDSRHEPIEPIVVLGTFAREEMDGDEGEINPFGVLGDAWNKANPDQGLDKDHQVGEVRNIRQGKVRGMLLEDVPDFETLESKVINPLLGMHWE